MFGTDPTLKCRKVILNQGEGLILPGGVPHMVRTTEHSIARGANFLWDKTLSKLNKVLF